MHVPRIFAKLSPPSRVRKVVPGPGGGPVPGMVVRAASRTVQRARGGAVHRNVIAVAAALRSAGAGGEVVELTASARSAAQAAVALGCPVGAVANSLLFLADGEPVLVLTSGDHRVDPVHTAAQLGVRSLTRPDAAVVRAATGQPIGGVAPVGHPRPIRTVVDLDLLRFDVVWAAAGTPHAVFPTTYAELLDLCGAEPVSVQP